MMLPTLGLDRKTIKYPKSTKGNIVLWMMKKFALSLDAEIPMEMRSKKVYPDSGKVVLEPLRGRNHAKKKADSSIIGYQNWDYLTDRYRMRFCEASTTGEYHVTQRVSSFGPVGGSQSTAKFRIFVLQWSQLSQYLRQNIAKGSVITRILYALKIRLLSATKLYTSGMGFLHYRIRRQPQQTSRFTILLFLYELLTS